MRWRMPEEGNVLNKGEGAGNRGTFLWAIRTGCPVERLGSEAGM